MKKTTIFALSIFVISIISAFQLLPSKEPSKATPPNIILIFMDDLGYGDLSCYGALQYRTPNLDRLAGEGIRFTNFLAAQAVCSASRAALLTGCYPNRVGISGALFPNAKVGLNPEETTIAELLKDKGYATGMFGKWHLGDRPEFLPTRQGFDEYVGLPYSNDMWPVHYDGSPISTTSDNRKKNFPFLPLLHNSDTLQEIKTLDDQAKLTGIYTERAVNFINRHKKSPFFVYLPHSMPHVPIAASAKFKGKSKQGTYGDVLMEIDWSVGEIMKALKENGLDKNTVVIFTSDNGPWLNYGNHAGSSGGLREGKGNSFEGGQRVPCIVRWKGITPAGLVCNKLTSTIDLLPTIAHICGTKLPARPIDGVDILPLLKGDMEATPRRYFYYFYRRNNLEAVRRDDWKLVLPHEGRSYEGQAPGNDGFPGKAPENIPFPLALYDLRRDPAERYDVKETYPEILAELQKVAEEAREDLGDDITKRTGKNVRKSGMVQ
ncbi:sulfatase family protein [Runella slithyformis]|uniref:Cerebroside-sulfatase n=1 Tax=Runella slithyformis (strain ATCC 29530 / DSM 19594 / LMG 11500 / NCIMB 11436 / LSU 4) TaxID=761193 RepID=A0A7U3ZH43_RUNSL|nr:sulfatase [Runella slithyformis]AEI47134.1 Cerebroside-sulfatase [Runella slithyformis DSM 19594]